MDTIFSLAVLGIVQGLTEFLPVSSTGHLILARDFLGFTTEYGLAIDAVLHLATALAVLVYFRKDILRLVRSFFTWISGGSVVRQDRTLIVALILGTIPAVIIGLSIENSIEHTFRNPELVAYALIGGSALFFIAERLATHAKELTVGKGILIGFFQALALIPGVSRSGATISGGLLLGLPREAAARFAFLLSFPVILGAGILKFFELGSVGVLSTHGGALLVGALAAFISGLLAIYGLLKFLKNNTLDIFIVYRLLLAGVILFLL